MFLKDEIIEIWKDIPSFDDYQVSNLGQIRSLDRYVQYPNYKRFFRGKILVPFKRKNGYQIIISINRNNTTFLVHRLVALCFVPNPFSYKYVSFKNNNPHDIEFSNLEWISDAEFEKRRLVGLRKVVTKKNNHKSKRVKITQKNGTSKIYLSHAEAYRKLNIPINIISYIRTGRRKNNVYKEQTIEFITEQDL